MSGNAVRLQAIMDVEAYVPPAHSFDDWSLYKED